MTILATPEFWVLASFIAFFAVLAYFKVPGMVLGLLDSRAETIRKELEEAKRLRDEAQAILADYERKQRDAETEVQDMIRQARMEADTFAEETRAQLAESLERRARLAQEKIARAEDQAVAEVRAHAVEIAVAAAERLIGQKLTERAASKLVDDSIKQLKGKLN